MMNHYTKDQHIVPVCYLRNFSDKQEQEKKNPKVWCYDKLSMRSYYKGIESICYSHKIYSINRNSEAVIDSSIKDKETVFESHYLHDIEQEYSPFLKHVIDSLFKHQFSGEQKRKLSIFIAIQYLRDPMIKGLCKRDDEPFFNLTVEYIKLINDHPEIKEDPSMMHYMYAYGNKDLITLISNTMATYEWTFFYDMNDGFYTSDSPLCPGYEILNDGKKKEHLLFPISKNILLQITKGFQINEIMYIENTPQWKIDSFNSIQAFYAKKYIVSCKNSFTLNKRIIENNMLMWDLKKIDLYQNNKPHDTIPLHIS